MMRLIDADALKDWSEIVPLTDDGGIDINDFEEKLKSMPTVDAIPVAFIESEKQRVQGMIEYAVKMGMMAEAERLSSVIAVLDAVVSNWRYTMGPDWRAEREEE